MVWYRGSGGPINFFSEFSVLNILGFKLFIGGSLNIWVFSFSFAAYELQFFCSSFCPSLVSPFHPLELILILERKNTFLIPYRVFERQWKRENLSIHWPYSADVVIYFTEPLILLWFILLCSNRHAVWLGKENKICIPMIKARESRKGKVDENYNFPN